MSTPNILRPKIRTPAVIVWFKRDLRLSDNPAFMKAIHSGYPIIPLFVFEPELRADVNYSERHFRFMWESLQEMNDSLQSFGYEMVISGISFRETIDHLISEFDIKSVFSNQETGNATTFRRDRNIRSFLRSRGIVWEETPQIGVQRGSQYAESAWLKSFHADINEQILPIDWNKVKCVGVSSEMKHLLERDIPHNWKVRSPEMQEGGSQKALVLLDSFVNKRADGYMKAISKPLESREKCSRLSPYLAWGNISVRESFQVQQNAAMKVSYSWDLRNFAERLRWRNHFIQKLEKDPKIELNYRDARYYSIRQEWNQDWFDAWKHGETGFPLVDACMRCLHVTGYINFRMRSMLVSFLTHHLWLDWKEGAHHLARLFLDYEPGIHYSQFQMQSGTSGTHTVRVYNPVKQGLDHDPDGRFVKMWVPELKDVPPTFIHQPWKLTAMEQEFFGVRLGKDYPNRLVDHEQTYKTATEILWGMKRG